MNAIKILSMGVLVANCLKIMNGGKGAENKNAVEGASGGREACVVISCFSCYPSSFQRSCGGFFCFFRSSVFLFSHSWEFEQTKTTK